MADPPVKPAVECAAESNISDAELIAGIRAGNQQAFAGLYHRYRRQIFATALAMTSNSHTAEEVLQDTFVRAFIHADTVDASTSLAPWLHRIALNLSANCRTRTRIAIPIDLLAEHLLARDDESPERLAERNELRRAVQKAIAELDFKHRAVVVLFYLQDFSLKETAYILDCPVGTVKSRLHYACQTLRRRLGPERQAEAGVPVALAAPEQGVIS